MMMLDVSTSMNGVGTAQSDLDLTTGECTGNDTKKSDPEYGYSRTYCTVGSSTLNNWKKANATAAQKNKAASVEGACNKQSNGTSDGGRHE